MTRSVRCWPKALPDHPRRLTACRTRACRYGCSNSGRICYGSPPLQRVVTARDARLPAWRRTSGLAHGCGGGRRPLSVPDVPEFRHLRVDIARLGSPHARAAAGGPMRPCSRPRNCSRFVRATLIGSSTCTTTPASRTTTTSRGPRPRCRSVRTPSPRAWSSSPRSWSGHCGASTGRTHRLVVVEVVIAVRPAGGCALWPRGRDAGVRTPTPC